MLDIMDRITNEREQIIAYYIARILSDLRLIDISDYITYAHNNKLANIGDIIEAATELHFITNTIRFAGRATYDINWNELPNITFYMTFKSKGVQANFRLTLSALLFSVQLDSINFNEANTDNAIKNTEKLTTALEAALLIKHKTLLKA